MVGTTGWDPLKELSGVRERMNRLFDAALAHGPFDAVDAVGAWTPAADVVDGEDAYRVFLELPGLDQANLEVRVDHDELVVEGRRPMGREQPGEHFHRVECAYGDFARRFALPSSVDRKAVSAHYRDGVLEVRVAKRSSDEPRAIRVDVR